MATTAPTKRPALGRSVRANLSTAELYEDAIRHGEGLLAADGPLVVRTGKHTGRSPEDKFIVDEPSSHAAIWWGKVNRPISRGELRSPPGPPRRVRGVEGPVQPGLLHRRRARPPTVAAGLYRDRLGEHVLAQPVPPTDRGAAPRLRPELHDHLRALVPGRPRDRGDAHRDGHPGPPAPDGDPDRRHRVRRRDQEERVHGDELPDARRGRAADALGHQHRPGRRRGGLLRALGDRQDDPLRRPAPEPDRR